MSSSAFRADKRSAWSNRFSSTSSLTTSAKTNLHSRAAHRDKAALSSPQGETIPAVKTLESRNSRIRRWLLTPHGVRESAGAELSARRNASCSGVQKHAFALPAVSPRLLPVKDRHA